MIKPTVVRAVERLRVSRLTTISVLGGGPDADPLPTPVEQFSRDKRKGWVRPAAALPAPAPPDLAAPAPPSPLAVLVGRRV